ncbi:MAG TPA: UDP-3-O-(3-hydroxymyristoyl)glucosamine N-acyltransferase [Geminicoccus sp.]|jgi:UDP-3-O-[3-hydroxymyristoyl] glucosamine N-acyltransferase|uniref:UDP-3-O-(3-hydroxymyristoyl)glucosamine N-acyltransferase n=1 Tax=Geminicoccus sp. TaxID=2024832 RepID=UPI002E330FA6|nr:UDP-3-O-(3-hydroxymyristoyl)glucosamine N-acyltransferase [Geminicoccus sp.]HEX2527656.1 UDP-3-O-(3-hydroxymyristoyl)glucosamine N-acyltransferase [Geminicoccus sp.]
MADPRFFRRSGPHRLGDLADLVQATLEGDPDILIEDVASLAAAGPGDIAFFDHRRYLPDLAATNAAAIVVKVANAGHVPLDKARLVAKDPQLAMALIATRFYPDEVPGNGVPDCEVSTGAHVHRSATLGEGVQVEAGAVVQEGASIGPGALVAANAVIGRNVVVGAGSRIGAGATLSHCLIGERVVIHPGTRIGQDGFGFAMGATHHKVPQLGRVVIEDDVEIGANTTIDRGSGSDTVIGRGTKIDNLVMIAHNVRIGAHCIIVAQSGISGSATVGHHSVLAAQSGIAGHLTVGPMVQLAARTGVIEDLPGGGIYGGAPAVPVAEWRRQVVATRMLGKRKKKGEAP